MRGVTHLSDEHGCERGQRTVRVHREHEAARARVEHARVPRVRRRRVRGAVPHAHCGGNTSTAAPRLTRTLMRRLARETALCALTHQSRGSTGGMAARTRQTQASAGPVSSVMYTSVKRERRAHPNQPQSNELHTQAAMHAQTAHLRTVKCEAVCDAQATHDPHETRIQQAERPRKNSNKDRVSATCQQRKDCVTSVCVGFSQQHAQESVRRDDN